MILAQKPFDKRVLYKSSWGLRFQPWNITVQTAMMFGLVPAVASAGVPVAMDLSQPSVAIITDSVKHEVKVVRGNSEALFNYGYTDNHEMWFCRSGTEKDCTRVDGFNPKVTLEPQELSRAPRV